jgi:hypothetical protein
MESYSLPATDEIVVHSDLVLLTCLTIYSNRAPLKLNHVRGHLASFSPSVRGFLLDLHVQFCRNVVSRRNVSPMHTLRNHTIRDRPQGMTRRSRYPPLQVLTGVHVLNTCNVSSFKYPTFARPFDACGSPTAILRLPLTFLATVRVLSTEASYNRHVHAHWAVM